MRRRNRARPEKAGLLDGVADHDAPVRRRGREVARQIDREDTRSAVLQAVEQPDVGLRDRRALAAGHAPRLDDDRASELQVQPGLDRHARIGVDHAETGPANRAAPVGTGSSRSA